MVNVVIGCIKEYSEGNQITPVHNIHENLENSSSCSRSALHRRYEFKFRGLQKWPRSDRKQSLQWDAYGTQSTSLLKRQWSYLIMLHRYLTIEMVFDGRGYLNLADEDLRRSSAWELKLDLLSLEIRCSKVHWWS